MVLRLLVRACRDVFIRPTLLRHSRNIHPTFSPPFILHSRDTLAIFIQLSPNIRPTLPQHFCNIAKLLQCSSNILLQFSPNILPIFIQQYSDTLPISILNLSKFYYTLAIFFLHISQLYISIKSLVYITIYIL